LWPRGSVRSGLDRRRGRTGAGAFQEYLERRSERKRAKTGGLRRERNRSAVNSGRCDAAGGGLEIPVAAWRRCAVMSKRSEGTDERGPSRDSSRDPPRDPWRAFVNVAQIPEGGLHREIEADV